MPQKGTTQVNNFVKGLVTEATALTFPDGASLNEENFELLRDGSRQRRLGLNYEDGFTLQETGLTDGQLALFRKKAFVWTNPGGSVDVEIGIIQIGALLYFVNLFTAAPSANLLNQGNALDATAANPTFDARFSFDFTIINNNVLAVSEGLHTPFLLSYDPDNDVVTAETARLLIRDFYGISDGLDDDERPTTLTNAHTYNLRNQGWSLEIQTTCGVEPLECTHNILGVYPSNSDIWTLGKIADVTSADVDKYDPETLRRNSHDLGRAPRGHFIIDLYNRGFSREQQSEIILNSQDRELGRVSTVTTLGGRAFYSGIRSRVVGPDNSPKLSGAVLFSQVIRNNEDLVRCYQAADPTSPSDSDVVDTDGGVIFITEASNIIDIRAINGSVFVFAENGIWDIRGDDGGFRATSFQVNKVSSVGVLGRDSIVEANGVIFFWGREGIFSMSPNQLDTGYDTVNITLGTIQSGYNSLSDFTKSTARGYYDLSRNKIRWLHREKMVFDDFAYLTDELEGGEDAFTGDEEVSVPQVIGDPVSVIFDDPPVDVDCIVLSNTKYVVVAVVSPSVGNDYLQIAVVNLDSADGVDITIGSAQTIEDGTSFGEWRYVSLNELTETKFIVYGKNLENPREIHGIVCELDASDVVTATAPQLITSDTAGTSIDTRCLHVGDGERSVLMYQSGTSFGGQFPPYGVVITVPSASTTISVGTPVRIGEYGSSRFDIDYNNENSNEFRILGLLDQPQIGGDGNAKESNRTITISGTTLTAGTISEELDLHHNSPFFKIADAGGGVWLNIGQETAGGPFKVVAADDNVITSVTATTTETVNNADIESIRASDSVRAFIVYGTTGASPNDFIEMEIFTYTGAGLIASEVIRIADTDVFSINISQNSLSETKSCFVYIDQDPLPDVVKTVVFEAGKN